MGRVVGEPLAVGELRNAREFGVSCTPREERVVRGGGGRASPRPELTFSRSSLVSAGGREQALLYRCTEWRRGEGLVSALAAEVAAAVMEDVAIEGEGGEDDTTEKDLEDDVDRAREDLNADNDGEERRGQILAATRFVGADGEAFPLVGSAAFEGMRLAGRHDERRSARRVVARREREGGGFGGVGGRRMEIGLNPPKAVRRVVVPQLRSRHQLWLRQELARTHRKVERTSESSSKGKLPHRPRARLEQRLVAFCQAGRIEVLERGKERVEARQDEDRVLDEEEESEDGAESSVQGDNEVFGSGDEREDGGA